MSIHRPLYLTTEQRQQLETGLKSGNAPARTQTRARILLLTDRSTGECHEDAQVASLLGCSIATVGNIRRRFFDEGLQAALVEKPRPGRAPKLTGDIEAQITVIACSDPPEGQSRWTIRLLTDRIIEVGLVDQISHVAVWERLKKTFSSPGK